MKNWKNGQHPEEFHREQGRKFREYLNRLSDEQVLKKSEPDWLSYAEQHYALHPIELDASGIRLKEHRVEFTGSDGYGRNVRNIQEVFIMSIPFQAVPQLGELLQLGLASYDISGPPEGWDINMTRQVISLHVGRSEEQIQQGRTQAERWIGFINATANAGRSSFLDTAQQLIRDRTERARISRANVEELRKQSPYPIDPE